VRTCAHRGARIRSNEVYAQPRHNGTGVVFIETVKGEAVVEQGGRLVEDLTCHLEVHLGPSLGYCLCGCQELIERWAYGAGRHTPTLSVRTRSSKRISRRDWWGVVLDAPDVAVLARFYALLRGWAIHHHR
jgi:hypothetical protein